MRKIILFLLLLNVLFISGCLLLRKEKSVFETRQDNITNLGNTLDTTGYIDNFEERLKTYIEKQFSKGYFCDELNKHKYFFDIMDFPYQESGQYLVTFSARGYTITDLGNITNCGGGGETIIVKDDGLNISLVHKFADFEKIEKKPDEIIKLLKKNKITNTTYEQAKKYFKISDAKSLDQKCPEKLCNKLWYSIIESGKSLNDDIYQYTTKKSTDFDSNGGRWTFMFFGKHTMIETHHGCIDGRCENTGLWENINNKVISYPLAGEPYRKSRFEIIEVTENMLKIRPLYRGD